MTEDRKQRRELYLISAVLIAATFVAYEPIRHNGFVNYDDKAYITENPKVTGGITLQSISWAFTKTHAANWHPLTWLSHMLDCRFFGLNPFWHHFVSVLFHIANALLLFWILAKMTGATWASAFVAAVFALHPLQVESVAWASERKTVLSGLFWFMTIAVYVWYTNRTSINRYILLFAIYALSIMTKPVVVTLPLVLLLLDYWPLERTKRENAGRLLMEKVPLLVLSGVLSVMTIIAQRGEEVIVPLERLPLDYRILNIFVSYMRYIGKTIWPVELAVLYPLQPGNLLTFATVVCILLFILISAVSIYASRHRRYAVAGWLWYVVTLVPMIGLVQVGCQAIADRYMYLSIPGLLIIAVWTVKDLVANRPVLKVAAALSAASVLLTLIILTRMQVGYWRSSITLFEHTLRITKNNFIAENNYGLALTQKGLLDEAVIHLKKSIEINPANAEALNNLGKVYLEQGKFNEAIACFSELLKHKKFSAETYYQMALVSGMQGKYDNAIKYLTETLRMDPNYPDAHNKMGTALLEVGKNSEAIEYLNEARRMEPDKSAVYVKLGRAYSELGDYEPTIRNWTRAVELDPCNVNILNRMAWLIATVGDNSVENTNKAIEYASRACELTGYKEPLYIDTLAVAYAAAGRFEDAVTIANKALDLANSTGQKELADEIQQRLTLYKSGQRYRQK